MADVFIRLKPEEQTQFRFGKKAKTGAVSASDFAGVQVGDVLQRQVPAGLSPTGLKVSLGKAAKVAGFSLDFAQDPPSGSIVCRVVKLRQ